MSEPFDQNKAVFIGRRALHESARWESAVEEYCMQACGGTAEDTRRVIMAIRKAVLFG
jgi:hypothetical protein